MKRLRYIITDLYKYTSILCLFFTAIASLYSNTANKIGLYIAIPITCILCTLLNKGFRFNLYEKILYLLFAWDFIAYIWASDRELAAMELHMILGAFFLVYSISILARYKELIPYLYFIYILLYISAWNYAYHNILIFMVDNSDRLNDENLNANTLAYYTFYVSFASYVLSIVSEKKIYQKLWSFIFWVMIPISFGVSILTASRQVLIIQIPLYLLLLYIRYIKGVSLKRKIVFYIISILCSIALSSQISNIYNNSYLKKRSEKNITKDGRAELAEDAIKISMENLPLGVGSGNFQGISITRQISHNSYLEALANMGIIGIALYSLLLGAFTYRQWQRYRKYKDKLIFAFFTFGIIYILDSIFFVFYNAVWLISFFMLVAAHSESYCLENFNTKAN